MKIAVIGGIGSGKSRVIDCIKELGERACDCDAIYRDIVSQEDYIERVSKAFGVVKDGVIDKKLLAQIVFSDKAKLKELGELAHPLIFDKVHKIYEEQKSNLYIEVSAFDLSMKKYFDEIVYVKCKLDKRVERVKIRNNLEEDYIFSIISSQLSDSEMESVADFI
ncbi:MAG: dephospho-CoA kinase, partial [Clostridia bacterium]|nr:dephospho-CoA kinase [Clostridia bacterium]